MDRRTLYHTIEWSVAVAACGWLVWKLATYDDYAGLWVCLQGMGWRQWLAIALCIALMPVNMAIEAWRWMTLWNGDATLNGANGEANELTDERLTFREAQRQVYYSKLAGLITPWRLGEYPARGVLMNEKPTSDKVLRTTIGSPIEQNSSPVKGRESNIWAKVLSMGAVGSATMTAAIVTAGAIGLAFSPAFLAYLGGSYIYALCAVAAALVLLLAFAPRALKKYAEVNSGLVMTSIGQSFVRLACWCVQLGLVMYALGGVGTFSALPAQTAIYYLLVTITPNVPLAEVGVRGAWAIVVFGSMNAALAGVLLWVINTLLPCLVWPFLSKNAK
ncbi:MAG: hypothetical protein ACI4AI_00780 [Paludibacteraceae bacterium]